MGLVEYLLILIIPALIGSATAVGWIVFKSADRALGDERPADFEERILDELDVLRVRVDAIVELLDEARLRGSIRDTEGRIPRLISETTKDQGLGENEGDDL
jgi:hypothetical protein